ncbi:MAG: hypothetical protein EXS16_08680 [Gemmataceae bacterium]|nr:hypothetical protein [Gemmataceae bacterium]
MIEGLIPLGNLTIIDGDPGQGKSFVTLDLAGAISLGQVLSPNGRIEAKKPNNVLILNAEDDAETTLIPRLRALGADLDHVYFVDKVLNPAPDRILGQQPQRSFYYDSAT